MTAIVELLSAEAQGGESYVLWPVFERLFPRSSAMKWYESSFATSARCPISCRLRRTRRNVPQFFQSSPHERRHLSPLMRSLRGPMRFLLKQDHCAPETWPPAIASAAGKPLFGVFICLRCLCSSFVSSAVSHRSRSCLPSLKIIFALSVRESSCRLRRVLSIKMQLHSQRQPYRQRCSTH